MAAKKAKKGKAKAAKKPAPKQKPVEKEKKPAAPRKSPTPEPSPENSSETSLDLNSLRKPALQELCREYALGDGGTAAELRARIEVHQQAELDSKPSTRVIPPVKKEARGEDTWRNVVLWRTNRQVDLQDLACTWDDDVSLLTTTIWPALLHVHPLKDSEIFALRGRYAEELRSFREVWRESWGLSDVQLEELTSLFIALWRCVDTSMGPKAWAAKNWRRCVEPATTFALRRQAEMMQRSGHAAASKKLMAVAGISWGRLGHDAAGLVKRSFGGGTARAATEDDDDVVDVDNTPTKTHFDKSKQTRCRKCAKVFDIAPADRAAFYKDHNKTCK